jgi:DNA-binding beta-propeller fold protein YncE
VDTRTGHVFVANDGDSATTLDNGLGGSVSMLDARSGRVLRTILVGRDPATVVAGEPTGRVFVVHGRPGHRGYFIDNGSSGTDVLDARSGARLRTAAVGASPADDIGAAIYTHLVAVDPRTGHAFVIDRPAVDRKGTSTRGSVSVLDARSGRVLRRIPVGTAPMALAVDETTTRLFVVNEDPERMPGKRPNLWGWIPRAVRRGVPWLSQPSPQTYNGSVTVIDPSRV